MSQRTEHPEKLFFSQLDGLRFLCFLSVFLFHSFHTEIAEIKTLTAYAFVKSDLFGNGSLGVNFFFVLSGFLITFLLAAEKEKFKTIHVSAFWLRRILRIWPLYFLCVAFGFIAFPYFKVLLGQTPTETANPIWYVLFINNFDFIYHGAPDSSVLGALWSLAVEEQFYLVWPILLALLPERAWKYLFASIFLLTFWFRWKYNIPEFHEMHTLSCIGDMTVGAAGALAIRHGKFQHFIHDLSKLKIALLYLLFLGVYFFRDELLQSHEIIRVFERFIIAILLLFILLEQQFAQHSFFKIGNIQLFSRWGKISYGMYCLHFVAILIVLQITRLLHFNTQWWQVMIVETLGAFVLTVILSELSYRLFEAPFLRLKKRYSFFTRE